MTHAELLQKAITETNLEKKKKLIQLYNEELGIASKKVEDAISKIEELRGLLQTIFSNAISEKQTLETLKQQITTFSSKLGRYPALIDNVIGAIKGEPLKEQELRNKNIDNVVDKNLNDFVQYAGQLDNLLVREERELVEIIDELKKAIKAAAAVLWTEKKVELKV